MTMKHERFISVVLAAMLLAIIMLVAGLEDGLRDRTAELPMVEMRIDTVWVHDTIKTPGPVVVREEVREVPADVDTAAILQQYFTARTLSDTFHLRDVATVRITDTVLENNIVGRMVDYELAQLVPSAVTFYPSEKTLHSRLALTAGMQLGGEQAAVMGGVRFKRTELGLGYDLRLRRPSVFFKYDLWQWQ